MNTPCACSMHSCAFCARAPMHLPSTMTPPQTLSGPTHALLTPLVALCAPFMHPCAAHAAHVNSLKCHSVCIPCTHTPPTHASHTHFSSVPLCAPCLAHGVGLQPWSRSASNDTRRTSASCCSSKTAIATGRGGKDGVSGLDLRRLHRGFAISTSVILLGLASWSSDRECGLDLWVWIRGGEALALYKSKLGSCAGAAPESGHQRADTNNGSGLDPHFMRSLAAVQKAVRSMLFSHVHFGFQQDLVLRSPRIRVHHRSSSAFITRASTSASPSAGDTTSQPSTSAPTRPATHVRAHCTISSAGSVQKCGGQGMETILLPPSPMSRSRGKGFWCHADSMPL